MPLALTRIDDRLIHGQVVVGWGSYLKPDRIILCNDSVASEKWQREMFEFAKELVTFDLEISILTEEATVSYLKRDEFHEEKIFLLVESPHDICSLVDRGAPIKKVNVGGMHFKTGKSQIAPYIFVDDDDVQSFKTIIENNIKLIGQDVPTAKKIDITELIYLL